MSTSKPLTLGAGPGPLPPALDYPAHAVHFYQDEQLLIEELTRVIGTSLISGDAAIVVATKAHREALARSLAARGLNLTGAEAEGRYVALDAAETLAQLTVSDQMPDPEKFVALLGQTIARAKAASASAEPCTVIFGEMVAVLWAEEKFDAAIRIEELWNSLADQHSFSLRCAYPMDGFRKDAHGELFMKVCGAHSTVLPMGTRGLLFSDDERLRTIAKLQQKLEVLEHEKALHASEQRFHLLVEAAQDYAIFMLDTDGRVKTWNKGGERIKGYKAADILGKHISCFYSDEDLRAGKPQRLLDRALRDGHSEDEGWRLRRDGTRFWANVVITALKDADGRVIGFSKVTRDFTERMQAHLALQDSKRQLQESEKSLRDLSLNLLRTQDEERRRIGRDLHDSLGQYLVALKMKLDGLQAATMRHETIGADDFSQCAELVHESIKEVRTISYLLYPPMLEELGLKSAIPWYLEGFGQRSGIQTTFEVSADFTRLERDLELALFRVLQESLTNVHRHSGSATADVHLVVSDEAVVLTIRDHGKGPSGSGTLGVGLRGMSERMRQLGGGLEMSSSEPGVTLTARVPLRKTDADPGSS
jgi:PAS domain S-box-containing protein